MAIKANIIGGASGLVEADVVDGREFEGHFKPKGLVTYNIPFFEEVNRQVYATNDTFGNKMAVDGSISGATDIVHNGTDTVVWTGSNISGTNFDFASTTVANGGTKSISAVDTVNNDTALFQRSAAISASTYVSLTGAIYISSWSTSGTKDVTIRIRLAGVDVSTPINLSDYINTESTDTWLNFIIPLNAFTVSSPTLDEITVTTVDLGAGPPPNYYLDDLTLTAGSGIVYTIRPTTEDVLRVYGISWTIIDAGTLALSNGTVRGLSYNKFGVASALSNGVLTRRVQFGITQFSNSTTQNSDIITGSDARLLESWDDGTNTYLKFYTKFASPVDLIPDGDDKYEFVVQDNLSGLISLTIRADAALLKRQNGDPL